MSTSGPTGMLPPAIPKLSAKIAGCKARKRVNSMKSDSDASDFENSQSVEKSKSKKEK